MREFKYACLTTVLSTALLNNLMAMEDPVQTKGTMFSNAVRSNLQIKLDQDYKPLFEFEELSPEEKFVRLAIEMILESIRLQEMHKTQEVSAENALNAGQEMFADLIGDSLKTPIILLEKSSYDEEIKLNPSNDWLENELPETYEYKFVCDNLLNIPEKDFNLDNYTFEEYKRNVKFYSNKVPERVVFNCNGRKIVGDTKLFYWSFWSKQQIDKNCSELMSKLLAFENTFYPPEKPYVKPVEENKISNKPITDEYKEPKKINPAQVTIESKEKAYKKFLIDGFFENKETALNNFLEAIKDIGWKELSEKYEINVKKDSFGNVFIYKKKFKDKHYKDLDISEQKQLLSTKDGLRFPVMFVIERLCININDLKKIIENLKNTENSASYDLFIQYLDSIPDMGVEERQQFYLMCRRGVEKSEDVYGANSAISKNIDCSNYSIISGLRENEFTKDEELYGKKCTFEKVDIKKCDNIVDFELSPNKNNPMYLKRSWFRFDKLTPQSPLIPKNIEGLKNRSGVMIKEVIPETTVESKHCLVKGITALEALGLIKNTQGEYEAANKMDLNCDHYCISEITEARRIPDAYTPNNTNTTTNKARYPYSEIANLLWKGDGATEFDFPTAGAGLTVKVLDGGVWRIYKAISEEHAPSCG